MKFYKIITSFIIGGLTVQAVVAQTTIQDAGWLHADTQKISPGIVWYTEDVSYELTTGLYFPPDVLRPNVFAQVDDRLANSKLSVSPLIPTPLAVDLQAGTKVPMLPEPGMLALVTVGGIGALLLAQRRK